MVWVGDGHDEGWVGWCCQSAQERAEGARLALDAHRLVEEARRENQKREGDEMRELFYAARNANAARTEGEKNHA